MNTIDQQIRATARRRAKELISDPEAYVESVGKVDVDTLGQDLTTQSVAVRLVLGATVEMPHRALSYVESAAQVARHFPGSQLQIVHANHLGNRINSVDIDAARDGSEALARHTLAILERMPELEGRISHASDTPHDTDAFLDAVHQAYGMDATLATKMQSKGAKHGGDANRYTAAHFAFQDTDDLELDVIVGVPQENSDTIISVGCQQERNFYLARMGMRACIQPTIDTAQIFTRHLTPPYYTARGGETLLGSALDIESVTDPSARRDLLHYLTITQQGE